MILLLIICIFIICIIILFKQHTVENLGTFIQLIDYNTINDNINGTCKTENIMCDKINSKYINKKNYDTILCLTNCITDTDKLKTCCDRKQYCSDNIGICEGDPLKSDAQKKECLNNNCTKEQCCDTENTLENSYVSFSNSLLRNGGTLNHIFQLKNSDSTYKNNNNYCKSACSLNDIPNCLGFSMNKYTNECSLFNIVENEGNIISDSQQKKDLYIKKKYLHLFTVPK